MICGKMFVAAMLVFATAGCAYAAENAETGAAADVALERFESPEGKFSVSVPAGWEHTESFPYKIDDTVNGVMLIGPTNMDGAAVKIAVLHYAGKGTIKVADHYFNMVLSNPTRLDADKETKFSEVEVAGKKGKTFTFTKFELIYLPFEPPPMKEGVMYEMNPPTKQVTMIDLYIVIPAQPGFYSLRYEAPEDIYEEYAGVFDAVVKSFTCNEK